MKLKFLFAIALPALIVCGAYAAGRQEAVSTVAGASGWVPFVASLEQTALNGQIAARGMVAQAADGSFRWEVTYLDHGDKRSVMIRNAAQLRFYDLKPGETTWVVHPMQPGPRGVAPAAAMVDRGFERRTHEPTGLAVVVSRKPSLEEWLAPELNFYAVRRVIGSTVIQLTSVSRTEPPAALFLPPADAVLVEDPTPSGLIHRTAEQMPR